MTKRNKAPKRSLPGRRKKAPAKAPAQARRIASRRLATYSVNWTFGALACVPRVSWTPSKAEIRAEISTLRGFKSRVRRWTFFGDDNQASIAAQIAVLRDCLTYDQIYNKFGVSRADEQSGKDQPQAVSQAIDARQWLDAEGELPSAGWRPLLWR